ncbi:MAG TPA: hypothetical protein DC049_07210 [Spirochaetia bacterium]|nr:hypothetical protein [Spirochaetia bacterium]
MNTNFFYIAVGLLFTVFATLLFFTRKNHVLNGVFYYPLCALLFYFISVTVKNKFIEPRLFFMILNFTALAGLYFLIPRRNLAPGVESKQMRTADKIITASLIFFQRSRGKDFEHYIEHSDLSAAEKKTAGDHLRRIGK